MCTCGATFIQVAKDHYSHFFYFSWENTVKPSSTILLWYLRTHTKQPYSTTMSMALHADGHLETPAASPLSSTRIRRLASETIPPFAIADRTPSPLPRASTTAAQRPAHDGSEDHRTTNNTAPQSQRSTRRVSCPNYSQSVSPPTTTTTASARVVTRFCAEVPHFHIGSGGLRYDYAKPYYGYGARSGGLGVGGLLLMGLAG